MSRAKCIMVQGTMSGAGKSLLCAALCRIFAQDGLRAVPFKSQNMALNSFVTKDGLEMGRAQVVQAQAAGVEPDVRMNPILLKPSSDVGSQVIVNGEVRGQMKAADYFRHKKQLIPDILAAYNSLAEEVDISDRRALTCVGVLNETTGGVSDYHAALVYVLETDGEVTVRETEKMSGTWATPAELEAVRDRLETWSQIALDAVIHGRAR